MFAPLPERMSARAQQAKSGPVAPKMTSDEVRARVERAKHYQRVCAYGCLTCCGAHAPTQEGGLRCVLLDPNSVWDLEPDLREKAVSCSIPALYDEVVREGRSVTAQEVLQRAAFLVRPETLWYALVEDGMGRLEAQERLFPILDPGEKVIPADAFRRAFGSEQA